MATETPSITIDLIPGVYPRIQLAHFKHKPSDNEFRVLSQYLQSPYLNPDVVQQENHERAAKQSAPKSLIAKTKTHKAITAQLHAYTLQQQRFISVFIAFI